MDITQLIGNIGFPAVMCLLMYHMTNTTMKDLKEAMSTMEITLATLKTSIEALSGKIVDHYRKEEES